MGIEFSVARDNLKALIAEYSPLGELSNEAQTRFSFVDRLLQECLGWPNGEIRVEVFEDGARTDYECGIPRSLIIEAKKTSAVLKFPPRAKGAGRYRLESLIGFCPVASAAIAQAQEYCVSRGVGLCAVANGPQIIVFLATRTDGLSPLKGEALVFDGYEDLLAQFAQLFDALSHVGVKEDRYKNILSMRGTLALPAKISSNCLNYYAYNYSNSFQESLRNAASLVIEDLGRSSSVEVEFFRNCYCESGPLTQYSLLGKGILAARYAALFDEKGVSSAVAAVNPKKYGGKFSQGVLAEAIARRPLVLIGDVGVGKTSFVKHLIFVGGEEIFKGALAVYFDLGAKGALSLTPKDALLNEIERTLREDFKVNKFDKLLLEAVYSTQLSEFDSGVMSTLRDFNPALFVERRLEYLNSLMKDRESNLRLILEHLARAKKCQIVIVVDNADQRSAEVQHEAFVIAQELCANWNAIVFIALRPQTFHSSKRSGAVSAYPSKVFVIPPPKLEDALDKRLAFALEIAEGRMPVQSLAGVSLHLDSLASLIRVLRRSLARDRDLLEFLVNVTGGNVRLAVELIARFFGNPNVHSEKIVRIEKDGGQYQIPVHEFAKTALLGDYAHFQEDYSVASNVFDVSFHDSKEHFLSLLILGYLSWTAGTRVSAEGFVRAQVLFDEMQGIGFTIDQVKIHLVRLNRKKLIETSERRTLEGSEDVVTIDAPDMFRATSLGHYILKRWAGEFAFLEAMSFDTPIFDPDVRTVLLKDVNDSKLATRYERAASFRDYLSNQWKPEMARQYFDWTSIVAASNASFTRVEKRLSEQGLLAARDG